MSVLLRSLIKVQEHNSNTFKFLFKRLSEVQFCSSASSPLSSQASVSCGFSKSSQCRGLPLCTKTVTDFQQTTWADVCVQSVRNSTRKHYQPSAWKRVNKHGIEKRLLTESGIHVLWRRLLKNRFNLAPFERILPGTIDGKILPKHQIPKVSKKEIERILKQR